MNPEQIIVKPAVTEKMNELSEKKGQYGFIVEGWANKIQIKDAVEKMYGVKVDTVNTLNVLGKKKSRHTKKGFVSGRKKSYKKAFVSVAKGEVIDFYSNI